MRTVDEPVAVRPGLVDGRETPELFLWRDRLWLVRDIVTRRAGESLGADQSWAEEIWCVVASPGAAGTEGVYELARRRGSDNWRLRCPVA